MRSSLKAHPDDLWKSYFTSSKVVKQFRKMYGEPDVIEIRQQFECPKKCASWEHRVLKRMRAKNRVDYLNQSDGCFEFTMGNRVTVRDMTGQTLSVSREEFWGNRDKYSGITKGIKHGPRITQRPKRDRNYQKSEEHRVKISTAMKSSYRHKGQIPNGGTTGRVWCNNGIKNKCVPRDAPLLEGYVLGMLKNTLP